MPTKDPRIDAFIKKAQPFAQPILTQLRATVHQACPKVEETIKWGMPHFDYNGRMMAMMASFRAHAVFGFWQGKALLGASSRNSVAMGDFGRLTSVKDLPPKRVTIGLIRQAMKLNEEGTRRAARRPDAPKKPLRTPRDLAVALAANKKAASTFVSFPPGQKREYIEWITGAKSEVTRERRLEQAIEWMAEGKRRNWRYER